MKKKLILIFSIIAILAVSACSAVGTTNRNATQTVTTDSDQLPALSKLVVGTYKLIGSSTPVTAAQAKELVILWKAYKELQTRDTKAKQEVTDLLTQINSSLTTEQIAAIDAMNLSARDVMSLVQELGLSSNAVGTSRTGSSSTGSSSSSNRGTGGFPGGGVPPADGAGFAFGGGGGQFGGSTSATPSASMRATIQARRASSGAQTATMALLLIDPLITKLESIANQG